MMYLREVKQFCRPRYPCSCLSLYIIVDML